MPGKLTRCLGIVVFAILEGSVLSISALQPEDIIINEIYFDNKAVGPGRYQAVELLVVKDQADINSLLISDRSFWKYAEEDQCLMNDLGQGFLNAVPSGTLIVIYNAAGVDDTDASDFTMRFFAKSSLFCNVSPTANAFRFNPASDNLHLLHLGKQIDFVKFRSSDRANTGPSDPGNLNWEKGADGFVDVGPKGVGAGFKFMGDKPDLNNYLATWLWYPDTYLETNNLVQPNGGRNTKWIESLRNKAMPLKRTPQTSSGEKVDAPVKR